MKMQIILAAVLQLVVIQNALAAPGAPQRVRIGVDIRVSYQSCIEYWTPITAYLSRELPEYRFVIVPIASKQDMERLLEERGVDFVSLDPAMQLVAEDRFGIVPLATIVELLEGEKKLRPANETSSGAIVRRAARKDLQKVSDLRGQRVSAVRPWSLTGWISQWGLLVQNGIRPQSDLKQVLFLGTHGEVVNNVLNGTTDVGVVDADILYCFAMNRRIPPGSLFAFDQQGNAVPVESGKYVASTPAYPGRLFSKTANVSDQLAKRVAGVLMRHSQTTVLGGTPCTVQWTIPSNCSQVRRLLGGLLGADYANSPGYPPVEGHVLRPYAIGTIAIVALVGIMLVLIRGRYARQRDMLEEQLLTTQQELAEVRAERQRINTILATAGCGIDIVDEDNRIVYADAGLERRFGDWRGKKCHNYYCDSDEPCPSCKMPEPEGEQRLMTLDIGGPALADIDDPHARMHHIEGQATRMVGIPFRDEAGRWMYARIHFPMSMFVTVAEPPLEAIAAR